MNDDNNDDDDNPIDRALNISPPMNNNSELLNPMVSIIESNAKNDSALKDFTYSRANIRRAIESGTEAIDKLSIIAEQSQNPRAFEVIGKLMDSIVVASSKLMEIQEQIRAIDKIDVPQEESKKSITNNLFVGSTSELHEIINKMKNN
jgi:hypothetical protein